MLSIVLQRVLLLLLVCGTIAPQIRVGHSNSGQYGTTGGSDGNGEWVVITKHPLPMHELRHSLLRYFHAGSHHLYVLRGHQGQIAQYTADYDTRVMAPNIPVTIDVYSDTHDIVEHMQNVRREVDDARYGQPHPSPYARANHTTAPRSLESFTSEMGTGVIKTYADERHKIDAVADANGTEVCRSNANVDGRLGYSAGGFSWGVDRVDQDATTLDYRFCAGYVGTGTHLYILDTGVNEHETMRGRVRQTWSWFEDDGIPRGDENGHGTHVAGLAGSSVYGVATNATIHNIQVLGASGRGTFASVAAGILWVYENGQVPGVINMSLGSLDVYVEYVAELIRLLAVERGILTVVSAGNSGANACRAFPAAAPEAVTVASSRFGDRLSSFSNYGPCVDVVAPGSDIVSSIGAGTAVARLSGTSMAAPIVAGLLATVQEKVVQEITAVDRMHHAQGRSATYVAYYNTRAYGEYQHRIHIANTTVPNARDVLNLLLQDADYGPLRGLPPGTPNVIPLAVRTERAEYPVPRPPAAPSHALRSASVAYFSLWAVLYLL